MAVSTKEFLEVASLQWPVTVSFEGGWFCVQSPVWGLAVGNDLDAACVEAVMRSIDILQNSNIPVGHELYGTPRVKEFLEYIIREGK